MEMENRKFLKAFSCWSQFRIGLYDSKATVLWEQSAREELYSLLNKLNTKYNITKAQIHTRLPVQSPSLTRDDAREEWEKSRWRFHSCLGMISSGGKTRRRRRDPFVAPSHKSLWMAGWLAFDSASYFILYQPPRPPVWYARLPVARAIQYIHPPRLHPALIGTFHRFAFRTRAGGLSGR